MIETIPIEDPRVVALRVSDKLEHADYQDVIVPRLESAIEEQGKLRCLCVLGEDYGGITPGAVWDEIRFDAKHRKDFERVAIVTDDRAIRAAVALTRPLFHGEVRVFSLEDQPEARRWVTEG